MGRRRKSAIGSNQAPASQETGNGTGLRNGKYHGSSSVSGIDECVRVVIASNDEQKEQTFTGSSTGGVDYTASGGRRLPDIDKFREPFVPQPPEQSYGIGTRDHYTLWCRLHKKYVELLYDVACEYIKSFKSSETIEPTIRDFYAFAYRNSSGYISPYL